MFSVQTSTEAEGEERLRQDDADPATKEKEPLAKLLWEGSLGLGVWGWAIATLPSLDAAIGLGVKIPIFLACAVTSFCAHGQGCDHGGRPRYRGELGHERS